jgi:aspartate aminotransferase
LTPASRFLLLNTPANPTGSHYSQEQMDALIDWALDRGLFVISDEIYDQLVYPPARLASASNWLNRAPKQVAVVNGLSKSMGMTGWRIGYALTDPELIAAMVKLQGQTTSNICSIAQRAAEAALRGPFDRLETTRVTFASRRDAALKAISAWPGTTCSKPDGAFYLFPNISDCLGKDVKDSNSLASYILEQTGVAVVPGSAFGDDKCIRLSYALKEDTLIQAIQRIGLALDNL